MAGTSKKRVEKILKDYGQSFEVLGNPDIYSEFISHSNEKIPKRKSSLGPGKPHHSRSRNRDKGEKN